MYLGSSSSTGVWHGNKSRGSGNRIYKRTKTILHMKCDMCGSLFDRNKGDMDAKRLDNTKYKHGCENCKFKLGQALGQSTRQAKYDAKAGTETIGSDGYVLVCVGSTYPFRRNVYGGKIRKHQMVMEMSLNRELQRGEIVHHIDGDKLNNSKKNLQLMTIQEHNKCHGDIRLLLSPLMKNKIIKYNKKLKQYEISASFTV